MKKLIVFLLLSGIFSLEATAQQPQHQDNRYSGTVRHMAYASKGHTDKKHHSGSSLAKKHKYSQLRKGSRMKRTGGVAEKKRTSSAHIQHRNRSSIPHRTAAGHKELKPGVQHMSLRAAKTKKNDKATTAPVQG